MAIERSSGLTAAIGQAGGLRALARKLGGISDVALGKWRDVPQHRLFDVARVTGLEPALLRPDLAEWVRDQRFRQRMEKAAEVHGLARRLAVSEAAAQRRSVDQVAIDILVTQHAIRFVAEQRGLSPARILSGRTREDLAARSLAMALAVVAGRVRSQTVGFWFGTSRQNADNAAERYLRARDGDDIEDQIETDAGAKVIERGRLRPTKTADETLWSLERGFLAAITIDEATDRRRA